MTATPTKAAPKQIRLYPKAFLRSFAFINKAPVPVGVKVDMQTNGLESCDIKVDIDYNPNNPKEYLSLLMPDKNIMVTAAWDELGDKPLPANQELVLPASMKVSCDPRCALVETRGDILLYTLFTDRTYTMSTVSSEKNIAGLSIVRNEKLSHDEIKQYLSEGRRIEIELTLTTRLPGFVASTVLYTSADSKKYI